MKTIATIVIGTVLLAVFFCVSLAFSIFAIIGVCKIVGVNPYDGYWMYGFLTAPIVFVAIIAVIARADRRKKNRNL